METGAAVLRPYTTSMLSAGRMKTRSNDAQGGRVPGELEDAVQRALYKWARGPASEEQIDAVEAELKVVLPIAFREILRISDGLPTAGEVVLYETARLRERNEQWAQVPQRAPGFVAIGDDSGGRVLLMKAERGVTSVELCDVVALDDPSAFLHVADSLHDWVHEGLEVPST